MRSTPLPHPPRPRPDNVIPFPEERADPLATDVAFLIAEHGYAEVLAEVQLHRPVDEPKPRGWKR